MSNCIQKPLRISLAVRFETLVFAQAALSKAVADELLALGPSSTPERHAYVGDLAAAAEFIGKAMGAWRVAAIEIGDNAGDSDAGGSSVVPFRR